MTLRRLANETWLDAAVRLAGPRQIGGAVFAHYVSRRDIGLSEEEAALSCCLKFGMTDLVGDDE